MDAAREHYSGTPYATRRCPRLAIDRAPGMSGVLDLFEYRAGIGAGVLSLASVTVSALDALTDGHRYAEAHSE